MPNKWHMCKEGQAGNINNNNAAVCLCFPNYLAFLRPAADRAVYILPLFVSRGRSYGFLWADSILPKKSARKDNPAPAYSPVSDRRRLTALVEVLRARRVHAPMLQISGPNSQKNHIIETCKEEGCTVSTQETAARRKWEMEHLTRLSASWTDSRPHPRIANHLPEANNRMSLFENCSSSTARRGSCYSALSRTLYDEGVSCSVVVT
jgi:hypothetical protein